MRRSVVYLTGAITIVLASLAAEGAGRPNVLLFLVDDFGKTDAAIEGSTFYETPNLDRLARSGVRCTEFYSSHPVCSPTRAALMTGKVPQRLGITDWIHPGSGVALPAEEITLGETFLSHGYQTAYLGKWHLGEADHDQPTRHGFPWTRGVNRAGQPSSYFFPFRATTSSLWDVPDLEGRAEGDYLTDALTDCAIQFLDERDAQRPFFICFGHYAVHTPISAPQDLMRHYQQKRRERFGETDTPRLGAPFAASSRGRQDDPTYGAMVENLDANAGRLLQALESRRLREETIVVFTSDNGGLCTLAAKDPGPTCNLPWRAGKGWHYEGGIRVPCYISWPARLPPGNTDVPGYTADLYPTLLELCGLPALPEQHIDGCSLVPELLGQADAELRNRYLAWYYPHEHGSGHRPSAAIRHGRYKMIQYLEDGRRELFDLIADPGETTDVSGERLETLQMLSQQLAAWIASTVRSK